MTQQLPSERLWSSWGSQASTDEPGSEQGPQVSAGWVLMRRELVSILEGAGLQVHSENWAKLLYRRVKKNSRKSAAKGSVMLGTIMSAQHTAGVYVNIE